MPYPQFSDVLSIASFPDTLPHFHFRIEMQPLTFSTYLQNPFFFFLVLKKEKKRHPGFIHI